MSEDSLRALAPLARTISETIQVTPVKLGSLDGSVDLTQPLTLNVAAYVGEETRPLVDALSTVYQSMVSCTGDEWAMEWLGEVWSSLPLRPLLRRNRRGPAPQRPSGALEREVSRHEERCPRLRKAGGGTVTSAPYNRDRWKPCHNRDAVARAPLVAHPRTVLPHRCSVGPAGP